jgi:CHAD domain-containing protein
MIQRRAATAGNSAIFHEVRIKTKSFRYTMELIALILDRHSYDDLIEWLKGIQDELGEWRDQTELCRRVSAILSETSELQIDPVATAIIDSARRRTQIHDEHARRLIVSLPKLAEASFARGLAAGSQTRLSS